LAAGNAAAGFVASAPSTKPGIKAISTNTNPKRKRGVNKKTFATEDTEMMSLDFLSL
jgi:hypothetical protein